MVIIIIEMKSTTSPYSGESVEPLLSVFSPDFRYFSSIPDRHFRPYEAKNTISDYSKTNPHYIYQRSHKIILHTLFCFLFFLKFLFVDLLAHFFSRAFLFDQMFDIDFIVTLNTIAQQTNDSFRQQIPFTNLPRFFVIISLFASLYSKIFRSVSSTSTLFERLNTKTHIHITFYMILQVSLHHFLTVCFNHF